MAGPCIAPLLVRHGSRWAGLLKFGQRDLNCSCQVMTIPCNNKAESHNLNYHVYMYVCYAINSGAI